MAWGSVPTRKRKEGDNLLRRGEEGLLQEKEGLNAEGKGQQQHT